MFTFKKKKKQTGLAGVGYPNADTIIKHKKQEVGEIAGSCWHSKDSLWHVRLMLIDGDNWKWVTLKAKFESESDARAHLNANAEKILALNLYHMKDD